MVQVGPNLSGGCNGPVVETGQDQAAIGGPR